MKLLEGKTAIVTGANRGIGRAIARKCAEEGANVAFTDLFYDDNSKSLEAELSKLGVKCKGYASDASNFGDTEAVIKEIIEDFESIDILTKPGFAEKITAPILIISAGDDKVVSIKAQKRICSSLSNCRSTEITGARHEILMEIDAIRSVFWDEFDRFTGAGLTL